MSISPLDARRVQSMLAQGLTHAAIRRKVRVSWSELMAISRGKVPAEDAEPSAERCPGCGAKVYVFPCVACTARGHRRRPMAAMV